MQCPFECPLSTLPATLPASARSSPIRAHPPEELAPAGLAGSAERGSLGIRAVVSKHSRRMELPVSPLDPGGTLQYIDSGAKSPRKAQGGESIRVLSMGSIGLDGALRRDLRRPGVSPLRPRSPPLSGSLLPFPTNRERLAGPRNSARPHFRARRPGGRFLLDLGGGCEVLLDLPDRRRRGRELRDLSRVGCLPDLVDLLDHRLGDLGWSAGIRTPIHRHACGLDRSLADGARSALSPGLPLEPRGRCGPDPVARPRRMVVRGRGAHRRHRGGCCNLRRGRSQRSEMEAPASELCDRNSRDLVVGGARFGPAGRMPGARRYSGSDMSKP